MVTNINNGSPTGTEEVGHKDHSFKNLRLCSSQTCFHNHRLLQTLSLQPRFSDRRYQLQIGSLYQICVYKF